MLMILGCVGAYMGFTHVQVRVANWLDPFADPQGAGYQMLQGLYSMADGDLFGVGIGRGLAYQIPVVESDFIFAAIAEECGLMGSAGVLLVYLSFAIRGYLTAARAKSDFSSMVAVGLTTTIVPSDGPHLAIRQPRWIFTAGQLHRSRFSVAMRRRGNGR